MPGQGSNTTVAMYDQQYTVKIQTVNTNGKYISGFGLANEVAADDPTKVTSAFIVAAEKFAVINPSTYSTGFTNTPASTTVPFAVVADQTIYVDGTEETIPGGVYMNTAFINKATISTLLAGTIVGDYIKAGVVMDAPHIHVGTINIGTINKPTATATDPRTWSHTDNGTRISNFSVDANGVMHATGAVMNRIEIKAENGTTLLNSNGVLASSGGNLAFNGNLDQGLVTLAADGTTSTSTSALEGWATQANTASYNTGSGWARAQNTNAVIRQNSARFPVKAGEDLYVYCTTGSTTGMWMAVAYFDNPDGADANTGYSCITAVALSASTMSTETITGESGASRQFAVGKVTVPTSGYSNSKLPRYGELRFGSNNGDIYFFSVGVSRTPPVLDPLYASTYIRNLSVDTLQIQDEAVTIPDGETATGLSINIGSTYVDVSSTLTMVWDSDKSPSALIISGAMQMVGEDTSGTASNPATVSMKFIVEWRTTSGSTHTYTYDSSASAETAASQSMPSSYGGQVVTTVKITVPSSKTGVRVHIEGRNNGPSGGLSTSRKCEGFGYFIVGAKK